MSKCKERAWRAFYMLSAMIMYIAVKWPISDSGNHDTNFVFWVILAICGFIVLFLTVIAITGWCNIDICKYLGFSSDNQQEDSRPPRDRHFDKM